MSPIFSEGASVTLHPDKRCASGTALNGLRLALEVTAALNFYRSLPMKAERFAGHHEAREALVLSVAGVTAIMLIANLILMIFY